MSRIIREDIDSLNSVLTVVVEKNDYEPKFKSELKKYRDQAHLKGFRKGKVPMSAVRKMFGKGILAELVNDLFQKKLFEYIQNEKLNVVGQPLLSEGQEMLDFDIKDLGDFELKFDVGSVSEIEIQGLENDKYVMYKAEVPDDTIEKDLENARNRLGAPEEVDDNIQEKDMVKLEVKELDGTAVKEDGVSGTFTIMMERMENETTKSTFLSKKKGDTLNVNILELEELNANGVEPQDKMEFVKKYYLGLDPADEVSFDPEFEAHILEVKRSKPAEMDEDFFQKMFPEEAITSKSEAMEKIREDYNNFYEKQAGSLLYKEVSDELIEINDIQLPDEFLKRWLKSSNEKLSEKSIEEEYPKFAKQMKWTLLRDKMIKDFELKVEHDEVLDKAKGEILRYMPYSQTDENYLNEIANKFLEDPKQYNKYHDEVMSDLLVTTLLDKFTFKEEVVSIEDFQKKMEQAVEESKTIAPNFTEEE